MAFRVKPREAEPVRKGGPSKEKDYLDFIRQLPCVVTGSYANVDAAHLSIGSWEVGHVGRGKSQKASDRWALPLCRTEHDAQHRRGDELMYWASTGINPYQMALVIHGLWTEMGEDALPFATRIIRRKTL